MQQGIHMKKILSIGLLIIFGADAMDKQQTSKEVTIQKMIALRRPDFEAAYDKADLLDLSKIGESRPVICIPSGTRMFYSGDKGPFQEERTFLRELAVTKEYAPLIPVLFNRWKNLEKHWIAQSMLVHAVCADMVANTQELLNQNVDPNQAGYYFFQQDNRSHKAIEIALGHQSSEMKCKSREIIDLLFSKKTITLEPERASEILLYAIEAYLHGSDEHSIVFEKLIENGANPFGQTKSGKTVKFNGQYYGALSAYDLASQLLKAEVSPETEQKDWYKEHKRKFSYLVSLFERAKPVTTP